VERRIFGAWHIYIWSKEKTMNLNISYFKAALICSFPLFLVPIGVLFSIKYGGNPGENYDWFGSRANWMMSLLYLIWLPAVIVAILLLLLAKKNRKNLGRYASLACIIIGVFVALVLYSTMVFE
jgi:cytochrome bd-type quinol oxidase subunit 2